MRSFLVSIGLLLALSLGLFWAVHRVPWLGPALADGLRAVLGPGPVAKLEDWAYAVDDRYQRLARGGEPPKTYWDAPASPPPSPPPPQSGPQAPALAATSRPKDVGPMALGAAGDGVWVVVSEAERPGEAPLVHKTMVHPDRSRSWAELFIVAIDLSRVTLSAMAGAVDPEALVPEARGQARPALVPLAEQADLVLAFNGGFKAEHGRYGMKVGGVTLIAPRDGACTIAGYHGGSLRIAPWAELAATSLEMRFLRQTPPCMYTRGTRHVGLTVQETRNWGAAVDGNAVIRRSAIGLDAAGTILYVGVSNATTAPAIADGMHHVGAEDVAQLDVNWSFPKILVFRRGSSGNLEAQSLFPGFVFDKDEVLRKRAPKDFFYVVRKPPRP